MSFTIVSAKRVVSLSYMSERFGVGERMMLETACVTIYSLFLTVNMVEEQGDSAAGWSWVVLLQSNNRRCQATESALSLWMMWTFLFFF